MSYYDQEEFEKFLDRIRDQEKNLPEHCTLTYNGKTREITVSVLFENSGSEPDEVVKRRALTYLQNLTPEERAVAEIKVHFQSGRPRRLEMRAQTSELNPERLKVLRQQAGLDSQ